MKESDAYVGFESEIGVTILITAMILKLLCVFTRVKIIIDRVLIVE